jgi:hypothetical protein
VGVRRQRSRSTVHDILEFFISVCTVGFCYKYVIEYSRTSVDVDTLSNHVNLYLSFLLLPLFILYVVVHGNIVMDAQELLNVQQKNILHQLD